MNFEQNITIKSNSKEVWDCLTVFNQAQQWNDCLLDHQKISDGEIREGFKSKNLIKEGNKNIWYNEEIIELIPYKCLKLKLSGKNLGKNPMLSEFCITETEKGVHINQRIEWQPSGLLLKLLHGTIEKMSKKNVEKDLNKLKEYLEN